MGTIGPQEVIILLVPLAGAGLVVGSVLGHLRRNAVAKERIAAALEEQNELRCAQPGGPAERERDGALRHRYATPDLRSSQDAETAEMGLSRGRPPRLHSRQCALRRCC
jgi:hypothetical protein